MKKAVLIIFSTAFLIIFFNLVIKNEAEKVYCLRKINAQIANVKQALFRLGVIYIKEEEKYIDSIKSDLYIKCLKS